jgi:SpoVK/Ycf46/Vps4 family AAA+-type ATPase
VFSASEHSNVVVMFDEADALFGKRSEVGDAQDRYANIEVAYLLQRMETYDGVLVLTTNLATNMDEAFSRRIHFAVDFPMPDQSARHQLWARALPAQAPVEADVDLDRLARMVPLSGGEIRNAALTAAFLAAHDDRPIGMAHLVRAVARQRGRQGKLPTVAEFGDYLSLVSAESA